MNSLNPFRIEGQKTASFEVSDQLCDAPDYLCIRKVMQVTSLRTGKVSRNIKAVGKSTACPELLGFQASGSAPIVENRVIENPETIATAIRIGNPAGLAESS